MVMKELTFKRTSIIAISLVVMCLMLTSVAGAKPSGGHHAAVFHPSNGIKQDATYSGAYNQKAVTVNGNVFNKEDYQMTLTITSVDTTAGTFTGEETLSSPQSNGNLIADVSGSFTGTTFTWTVDSTVQSTSTESPSIGEVDSGTLGSNPTFKGTGSFQGTTIGKFALYP